MSTEHNKEVAREFLVALEKRDPNLMASLVTEDATYWVQGKPELFIAAGEKKIADILQYMRTPSKFQNNVTMTAEGITAEGDRVALESESHGVTDAGKVYHNTYHFLLIFRGGKIAKVKEYLDTQHAAEFFNS